jgi:hypothetical protein
MRDMQASLEKLRTDAAEAALIRDLATDSNKRELFARLATHLTTLATEVERAIAVRLAKAVRQLRGGILVRPIADRARLTQRTTAACLRAVPWLGMRLADRSGSCRSGPQKLIRSSAKRPRTRGPVSGPPSLKGRSPGFGVILGGSGVLNLSPPPAVSTLVKRSQPQDSAGPPR